MKKHRKQSDFKLGDRVLVVARFIENGVDNGYFVYAGTIDRISVGSNELHVIAECPMWYRPDELMPFERGEVLA